MEQSWTRVYLNDVNQEIATDRERKRTQERAYHFESLMIDYESEWLDDDDDDPDNSPIDNNDNRVEMSCLNNREERLSTEVDERASEWYQIKDRDLID